MGGCRCSCADAFAMLLRAGQAGSFELHDCLHDSAGSQVRPTMERCETLTCRYDCSSADVNPIGGISKQVGGQPRWQGGHRYCAGWKRVQAGWPKRWDTRGRLLHGCTTLALCVPAAGRPSALDEQALP